MNSRSMNDALGLNVIAVDTAEGIGKVKSFVVNRTADAVDKIQIAGRKKSALFAAWDDLESFGDDAVMVRSADAPAEGETNRDADTARGTIDVLGVRILDMGGFEHGVVADVAFDPSSGAVLSVAASDGTTIATDAIASLGSYALIVRR